MAEKDMTEKALEAYNDVFADIVNGLLFEGRPVVEENDLADAAVRSVYKSDGDLHEQERDVAKYWKNGTVRIAFYGIENQTAPHADMPLRLFGYDGASYRAQLLADREGRKQTGHVPARYPVVTLVLYFGYKKHWDQPLTLLECLNVPEELKPYVNDYRMNLFEVAYLTDKQLENFHSDFRIVADYFVQMQRRQDYVPPEASIRHVHEFLQLMSAVTGDYRYEEIYDSDMERRQWSMCDVLDKVETKGIEKGMEKGMEKGIEKGENSAFSLIAYLLSHNRIDDLRRVTNDTAYRSKLMAEFLQREV